MYAPWTLLSGDIILMCVCVHLSFRTTTDTFWIWQTYCSLYGTCEAGICESFPLPPVSALILRVELMTVRKIWYCWCHISIIASQITGKLNGCLKACSRQWPRTIQAPHFWSFVSGIHRKLVDSPQKTSDDRPTKILKKKRLFIIRFYPGRILTYCHLGAALMVTVVTLQKKTVAHKTNHII